MARTKPKSTVQPLRRPRNTCQLRETDKVKLDLWLPTDLAEALRVEMARVGLAKKPSLFLVPVLCQIVGIDPARYGLEPPSPAPTKRLRQP